MGGLHISQCVGGQVSESEIDQKFHYLISNIDKKLNKYLFSDNFRNFHRIQRILGFCILDFDHWPRFIPLFIVSVQILFSQVRILQQTFLMNDTNDA